MNWDYSKFWRGRRVLVTGASGFVGGALVDMLTIVGAEVYVISRGVDFKRSLYGSNVSPMGIPLAHVVERVLPCDITDFFELGHVLKVVEPEYIFHLAAVTQVTEAAGWPLYCFDVNTMGTLNLLEAARIALPETKIIISSSDKVYGHPPPRSMPCTEETPYFVTHPYDASKAAAELVAQSYGERYGMKVQVARMANVYGPGDTNWKRLIPGLIRWTFRGDQPVIRSDGRQVRQYMYVSDAIHGLARIAMRMEHFPELEFWNLGPPSDCAYSVREVIYKTALVVGRDYGVWMREPSFEDTARDETPVLSIDSERAEDHLDWSANVDLDKGLALTAEWFLHLANEEYLLK